MDIDGLKILFGMFELNKDGTNMENHNRAIHLYGGLDLEAKSLEWSITVKCS